MTDKTFLRQDTLQAATDSFSKPRYHYSDTNTGEGVAFWYDPARDRLRMIDYIVEDTFDENGDPTVISPSEAAIIVKDWVGYLDQSGMAKSPYWSIGTPVIGEIAEIDMELERGQQPHSRSTLWAYTFSISRSVNGVPFDEQAAKIWIHRSGQVILVDLAGVAPKTVGKPGLEYSEGGGILTIRLTPEEGIARAANFARTTTSFEPKYVSDVVVYHRRSAAVNAELVRFVNFVLQSPDSDAGLRAVAGGSISVGIPITGEGEPFVNSD